MTAPFLQPKSPVFGWASLSGGAPAETTGAQQLPHLLTTSGRAALFQALLLLKLPAERTVLVPTYHCPTMVAPALRAGLQVHYYALDSDGLPELEALEQDPVAKQAGAMIVPHLFGVARSLAAVRAWCDRHGVALIEDCAHCLFGQAGERPVGAWGHYASASLTKFLPVPEAGLLASAERPLAGLDLKRAGLKAQVKGLVDVLELATRFGRLPGLQTLLGGLFRLKNGPAEHAQAPVTPSGLKPDASTLMEGCDLGRTHNQALAISCWLARSLPKGRVLQRRQAHWQRYAQGLAVLAGARPLFPALATPMAPYVFPLWVDDPEPVYRALHALNAPVFRWDVLWPDTPLELPNDRGALWSRHVLQLLCHQDLSDSEVERLIALVRSLTESHSNRS